MFSTIDIPRKWSIRNTCSSGTSCAIRRFSARADFRSVPNGFSSASRVPSGSSTCRSAAHTFAVTAGGSAK